MLEAFLVFGFAFIFTGFALFSVVAPYAGGRADPAATADAALTSLVVWLAVWVPATLSQTLSNLQTWLTRNYKYILLLLVLVGVSYGVYHDQPAYDKVSDAYVTSVQLPFLNTFVMPTLNVLRMTFNTAICFVNVLANLGRIVWNQFTNITLNCGAMDWGAIPGHVALFALSTSNITTDLILSGFANDVQTGPALAHLANAYSELNPLFNCQCNDLNFLWPIVLHPQYGLIQSPRLHYAPQAVFNTAFELLRVPVNATVGIAERIVVGCGGDRDCEVGRYPKFDRLSDLTCQVFTHTFGFLDDAFYSVDAAVRDKLMLGIPWTRPPRLFGLLAMPLCAASDFGYGLFDIPWHIDLFFTLDASVGDGNYAAEFPVERILSRFHNMTYQIADAGADISGVFATNLGCLIGRALNIVVTVIEIFLLATQRLFATNFDSDAARTLLGTPAISLLITSMENDVTELQNCLRALETEVGEVLTPTIIGLSEIVMALTRIVREFVVNRDGLLDYFGGLVGGVQTDVDSLFAGLNILAGAQGKSIRRFGAFGSVQCQTRDVTNDPEDLGTVEMESMHLNIMCALGTTVEMAIRSPFVVLEHVVDGILGMTRTAVAITTGSFKFETDLMSLFVGTDAPFDIGRENGFLEATCLFSDSLSMIVPSLLTLPPDALECPEISGVYVANKVYNLFRAFVRTLALKPVLTVRAIFQAFTVFLCDSWDSCLDFGRICNFVVKPIWKAAVVPTATIVIALVDTVDCFVDTDGTLTDIAEIVGQAFVNEGYNGGSGIVPCANIANDIDGGAVVGFLCDFFSTLTDLVTIFLQIFEKGFWQAIWDLISGPLFAVIESVVAIAECIWDQVISLFDKLGECGEALVDLEDLFTDAAGYVRRIERECGNWDDVFGTCTFTFTLPEFNVNSELPTSGAGNTGGNINPPTIALPDSAVFGSCIAPTGTCEQRRTPLRDHESNSCISTLNAFSVRAFVPGLACPEINATAVVQGVGACCVPDADCVEVTFDLCKNLTTGLGVKAVWSQDQTCSAMNADCVLQSPLQFGCCITPFAIGIFDPNLRHTRPGVTARTCYNTNTSFIRPYYVPGDATCAQIQAHPLYPFLLNNSDAVLDSFIASPILNFSDIELRTCTPEESLQTTALNKLYDTSCRVQDSFGSFAQPPMPPVLGTPNAAPIRMEGTGPFINDIYGASWWTCRSRVNWIAGNSFLSNVDNLACNFCVSNLLAVQDAAEVLTDFEVNEAIDFLNYETTIVRSHPIFTIARTTTPFADPDFMFTQSIATRSSKMTEDFEVECRWAYHRVDGINRHVTFTPFVAMEITDNAASANCAFAPVSPLPGFSCFTSDCRFRRQPLNNLFGPPKYDPVFEPTTVFDPERKSLDAVSSTGRALGMLYFVGGDIDLGRDVTGARCDLFAPVPITSAPDVYVARRLLSHDVTDAPLGLLAAALAFHDREPVHLNSTAHPCHLVYSLMASDNSSRQMNYLFEKELRECLRSNNWAHFIDGTALLHNSAVAGYRIVDPHFLYRAEVWDATWINATRGIVRAFSYNAEIYKLYARGNGTYLPTWAEFAADHGVRDRLGHRVGGFFAMLGQMTLTHFHQGRPVPSGLGLFGNMLSAARWQALRERNVTRPAPGNVSLTNPPLFSETGWEMLTNLVTFNWMNTTGLPEANYTEGALRIQRLRTLQNYTSRVSTSALISHGMLPATHALAQPLCDVRDRSCVDCELVVGSAETLVEVVLNCVEDLQDSDRFNLNIEQVDLTRDNTFLQRNDTLKCRNPEQIDIDNTIVTLVFNITDYIAGKPEGFARYWMARFVCYATNFDEEDPHSVLFYVKKFRSCDPITDGSAHRGRAGFGLRPAFLFVTVAFVGLLFVASFIVPIPTGWITIGLWLSFVLMGAYWWSPSCLVGRPPLPIPVLPDALADDLYVELRALIPRNCTPYDESVALTPGCPLDGRKFVDCGEFKFDYLGARHLAYLLHSIDPALPEAVRDTSVPVISTIMQTPYYNDAFTDVKRVFGTPIGEYCYGLNDLSLSKTPPLFFAIVQAAVLASASFLPLAIVFFVLALFTFLLLLGVAAVAARMAIFTGYRSSVR